MDTLQIIIADDEEPVHDGLKESIARKYPNAQIRSFYSTMTLLKFLRKTPNLADILFLDNNFEGSESGLDVLPKISEYAPKLPIIFLTGSEDVQQFNDVANYNIRFIGKPAKNVDIYYAINESIKTTKFVLDISAQIKQLNDSICKTKKWAQDVFLIASNDDSDRELDLENPEEWESFQEKTIEWVEKLKGIQINGDEKTYNDIKDKLCEKYRFMTNEEMSFLATGEYLLDKNTNDDIDFSPIIISFSKCLEGLLRRLLKQRCLIGDELGMMGECIHIVVCDRNGLGRDVNFTRQLNKFNKNFRIKAAHPSPISRSKAREAYNMLCDINLEKMSDKYLIDYVYRRLKNK